MDVDLGGGLHMSWSNSLMLYWGLTLALPLSEQICVQMGVWQAYSCSPNCSLSVLLISLFRVHVSFSRYPPCEVADTRATSTLTHNNAHAHVLAGLRWQGWLMLEMWAATSNRGLLSLWGLAVPRKQCCAWHARPLFSKLLASIN